MCLYVKLIIAYDQLDLQNNCSDRISISICVKINTLDGGQKVCEDFSQTETNMLRNQETKEQS